ncbi:MAG TPA: energy transducer TonB [Hyphomonadaceae bacterium]|nr:energy transducer TonB [Hyphomonadaceae bacterium]
MIAAQILRAGRRTIGLAGAALAVAASGCGSAPAPAAPTPQIVKSDAPANSERPAFFVQWKTGGMPGLTARPSLAKGFKLPAYPETAIRQNAAGTTSLEVCVTTDGKLVDVHVSSSSGFPVLDDATVEWAKTAKYDPAKFNGEPFAVCGFHVDYVWKFAGQN